MPIDPARVEAIFEAALSMTDTAGRGEYLNESCGGDAELRARVEALLEAHDATGNFLRLPERDPSADELREGPGSRIGRYKLLEQIGEGGFGVVFMAEQTEPVHRKVALKILKPGMDTRQVVARFEAERQALALMDHPNIAKVLDGGTTESGRPYFVMELVKGIPIVRYCDEHRLNPRQRLELFVPVCHAIQHAHQKGIIHRDLKPSNVLVAEFDERPSAMVIDFGVAKAVGQHLTDKTMFTALGQVIGTIEYMSPEQAKLNQLDIDTRTDIYSLGVLLYELLAGSTPFDRHRLASAAFDEMLRIIREEEPQKPSTRLSTSEELPNIAAKRNLEPLQLSRTVRGDLDWIVMKALEKERSRRYETANGLARDIDRYLHDEPIEARPPSAMYRLRKYVRRNKARLAVTGLALLSLFLLAGAVGWSAWDRSVREAHIARERAFQRATMERGIYSALDEVQSWQKRENWLEAESSQKRAEGLLAAGEVSNELLERVRQWRRDLDAVARLERIRMTTTGVERPNYLETGNSAYGSEFRSLGLNIDANPLAEMIAETGGLIRRSHIREQLTAALDHWGYLRGLIGFEHRGQTEEQREDWQRRPLRVARAVDDDAFRTRVRLALERDDSSALAEMTQLPESVQLPSSLLDFMQEWTGDWEASAHLLEKAQRARPDDFYLNLSLANRRQAPAEEFMENMVEDGLAYRSPPGGDPSLPYAMAAVALRPSSAWTWYILGISLDYSNRLEEAAEAYRKSIALSPEFAAAYANLGDTLGRQGELAAALAAYRQAIDVKPAKDDLCMVYNRLGDTLDNHGRLDEAAAAFRKAIETDPDDEGSYSNLAIVLEQQEKFEEAYAAYKKAVDLNPDYGPVHSNLAGSLLALGRTEEAIAEYRKAIELDPENAVIHLNLGCTYANLGRIDEAAAAYEKVFELKADKRYVVDAYCCLGLAWKKRGDLEKAKGLYQKAMDVDPENAKPYSELAWLLATCEDPKGRDLKRAVESSKRAIELDAKKADSWNALGVALYRSGEFQSALDALVKGEALRKRKHPNDQFFLAMAYWRLGKEEEARKWYQRAVDWMERRHSEDVELRQLRAEAKGLVEPAAPAIMP